MVSQPIFLSQLSCNTLEICSLFGYFSFDSSLQIICSVGVYFCKGGWMRLNTGDSRLPITTETFERVKYKVFFFFVAERNQQNLENGFDSDSVRQQNRNH